MEDTSSCNSPRTNFTSISNNSTNSMTMRKSASLQSGLAPMKANLHVTSKVAQYIAEKDRCESQTRLSRLRPEETVSLEDLYNIEHFNYENDTDLQERLRSTLRIVKEKDELIIQLRENCHELALKFANAENTIDALRFGQKWTSGSETNLTIHGKGGRTSRRTQVETFEKATETVPFERLLLHHLKRNSMDMSPAIANMRGRRHKENSSCGAAGFILTSGTADERSDEDANGTLPLRDPDARVAASDGIQSQDILDETCSSWLEKVQNWRTIANATNTSNAGLQDSTNLPNHCSQEIVSNTTAGDSGFVQGSCRDVSTTPVRTKFTSKTKSSSRRNTSSSSKLVNCPESQITLQNQNQKGRLLIMSKDIAYLSKSFENLSTGTSSSSRSHRNIQNYNRSQLDTLLQETTLMAKRVRSKSEALNLLIQQTMTDRKG